MSTFHLEIVTIERKIFDDQVNMVIAPGAGGVLGILPHHTPLITTLSFGELQVKKEGQEDQFFAVGGGFMEVQPDHVVVLADAAERADEIDVERAEAARRRAEEFLAKVEEREDFERAETALRRSIIRIRVAERRRRRGGRGHETPDS